MHTHMHESRCSRPAVLHRIEPYHQVSHNGRQRLVTKAGGAATTAHVGIHSAAHEQRS